MSSVELQELTAEPRNIVKNRAINDTQLRALKKAIEICNRHTDVLESYKTTPSHAEDTTAPDPMAWQYNIEDAGDRTRRLPVRAGTADELTEQVRSLSLSPPPPAATPSPNALGKGKARNQSLSADPVTLTPPKTPPSYYHGLSNQPSTSLDNQRYDNALNDRPVRRARLGKIQYGASPSRSPSRLNTNYREARVGTFDNLGRIARVC